MITFILNAIRRWFWNRQRYVFRYWNGQRVVTADPLVLYRDLMAHPEYSDEDFQLMQAEEMRSRIIGKLANITRQVFDIKTADEGGLTELECFQELQAFRAYTGIQKKSSDLTQTSPTPTDTQPSQNSAHEMSTNDGSESTSTSNDPSQSTL